MKGAVAKKNVPCGVEREFMSIIRPKIGPTDATKNSKGAMIRGFTKETLNRSIKIYDFARKKVYEVSCSKKRLVPKFLMA
jgi:hypothetical protein